MIKSKNTILVLSLLFLGLICLSSFYTISINDIFSYEVEESSKTEASENNNSLEEELKESKILFGYKLLKIKNESEFSDYIDYYQNLSSMFLPETKTPPPEFV